MNNAVQTDQTLIKQWLATRPDAQSVASFQASAHIQKLSLRFDIDALRAALSQVLKISQYHRVHIVAALP